jgi:membrane fusion protein (multidrug efflux system)
VACASSVLLAGAAVIGCDGTGAESDAATQGREPRSVSVEVARVAPELLRDAVVLTGQLEAEYDVLVKPEITGVIRSIEFAEGKPVSEGQVLFRLRDEEQRARLQEAEAQERLARDVNERTQRLTSEDISSEARRSEAMAALDEARAQVALARVQVERTRILAPFDGVAGALLVGPGELVEEENGLVAIAAIDRLQLVVAVPEPSVALARIGMSIQARVVAYPGERFPGEVFFLSPSIDRATRKLLIKAWVPNPDHRLKPGMFANVDVEIAVRQDALLVPEAALVYDRHGTFVWRVGAGDLAEKVPVEIGVRQRGRVEILAGLSRGDRIVSAGTNKLTAGVLVTAVGGEGSPASTARVGEDSSQNAPPQQPQPQPRPGAEG